MTGWILLGIIVVVGAGFIACGLTDDTDDFGW
jgi:hypothetical protein